MPTLHLTRRNGESVWIGGKTRLTVAVDGRRVRLVFEAPADVEIWREELMQAKLAEQDNRDTVPDNR